MIDSPLLFKLNNVKSIELTIVQQDHLLEMCRALFPEFSFEITKLYDDDFDEDNKYPIIIISIYIQEEIDKYKTVNNIGWFEFTSTILLERIVVTPMMLAYESGKLRMAMFQKSEHIIDYLYPVFLLYKSKKKEK